MKKPFALFFFVVVVLVITVGASGAVASARDIPSPEEHFGHRIGADRKLISWDGVASYLRLIGERSPRVNVREIGPSTAGRPFLLVEIASESTMADLDVYKNIQKRLYFQDHRPGQPRTLHIARSSARRSSKRARPSCSLRAPSMRPKSGRHK